MSHENRTPMNGIKGSVDILKDIIVDPNQMEYVDLVLSSCRPLMTIFDDVLDISKMEAGKLDVEFIPSDYKCLTEETLKKFKNTTDDNGNSCQLNFPDNIRFAYHLDPTRIKQVLMNLISNANKFTKNGLIKVVVQATELRPDEYLVLTSVHDIGIDITAA